MGIPTKVPIDLVNPTPAASTDLSDYVTLDTVQSITNKKSFSHIIINSDGSWQNGFKFINPKLTTDDPPSSSAFNTINYYGADNVRTGCVENYVSTTNDTFTKLVAIQHSSAASGSCELGVKVLADGTKQTFAPTPATADNSTQIATTAFVKNQGYIWRSCIVGQSSSTYTNPWYKVASIQINYGNEDRMITMLVEDTYGAPHNFGILRIHIRTDSDTKVSLGVGATELVWLDNTGYTLSDFVLVCPTGTNPTCELWTRIPNSWKFRRFTVLSEGTRTDTSSGLFTLLNASSPGQEASITTSGTQIISSFISSRQSIGQNGWIRYPDGLQMCWGQVNVPNDNTGHATVTFTKAFASEPRIFSNVSYGGQYATSVFCTQTGSRSTTGFDIYVNKIKDGAYSVDWGNICWFAIGNWI